MLCHTTLCMLTVMEIRLFPRCCCQNKNLALQKRQRADLAVVCAAFHIHEQKLSHIRVLHVGLDQRSSCP